MREPAPRDREQRERCERRDGERRERDLVGAPEEQHERHHERANERAGLVESFVHAEGPSGADAAGRAREHRVARRDAHALPEALGDDERGRDRPAAGKGQERHGEHVHHVAEDRDRPVPARPVDGDAGYEPHDVADELATAARDADHRGARAERRHVRADDAPATLVGHVREQRHGPHEEDERSRGPG